MYTEIQRYLLFFTNKYPSKDNKPNPHKSQHIGKRISKQHAKTYGEGDIGVADHPDNT